MASSITCLGCGRDITTDKGNRLLRTTTSRHVVPLWSSLMEDECESRGIPSLGVASSLVDRDGRMCRHCFGTFERASKLWDILKNSISEAATVLFPNIAHSATGYSGAPTPKRPKLLSKPTQPSPEVTIQVGYQHRIQNHRLTPSRKRIGKAIARQSKATVVQQCMRDKAMLNYIIVRISRILQSELSKMCSVDSILKEHSTTAFQEFSWDNLIKEIQVHAPVLLSVMNACTKTRSPRSNRNSTIGMCIAMLLKYRYRKMCLVQKILSLVLYAGHSSKQVYQRLQKLNICVSHQVVSSLIATMGSEYDTCVLQWKNMLLCDLQDNSENDYSVQNGQSCVACYTDTSDSESPDDCSSCCSDNLSSVSVTPPPISPIVSEDDAANSDSEDTTQACLLVEPVIQIENPVAGTTSAQLYNYKLVGDNIDFGIKARYSRIDDQKEKSLHYFHYMCLRDRANLSHLPIVKPDSCLNSASKMALQLLPTKEHDRKLADDLAVLVSRIIVSHMPFFEFGFSDVVAWHTKHQFYKEMSDKSEAIPLGVLLHNENKGEEMIKIMSHVHQFVPVVECEKQVEINSETTVSKDCSKTHSLLFGGDQLTAARIRGAQEAKSNSVTLTKRFDGLIPVIEDWHTKVVLLEVIWKYFYDTNSSGEHGTLYQLRNLINYTNVGKLPKHCFNSCDDFLETVITGHVLCTSLKTFGMAALDDQPSVDLVTFPETVWMQTEDEQKSLLMNLSQCVVENFIHPSYTNPVKPTPDGVYEYTKNLMSVGCVYLLFKDAIKEGDGKRVLEYYRYLLPIFINSGRRNYASEALNLLCQYHYDLPPQQAQQLIWSRFVNTTGRKGGNIPADLHLEHLNRILKGTIQDLGANKSEKAIVQKPSFVIVRHLV